MKVELMRSEIAKVYPGDSWKTRVKKMSEKQVIAIYHSFLRNDIFNLLQKERTPENIMIVPDQPYEQLNLFDMVGGCDFASGKDYTVENGVIK